MKVIAQDGKIINLDSGIEQVEIEHSLLDILFAEGRVTVIASKSVPGILGNSYKRFFLGIYTSKERALQVIQEINNAWDKQVKTYVMPKS